MPERHLEILVADDIPPGRGEAVIILPPGQSLQGIPQEFAGRPVVVIASECGQLVVRRNGQAAPLSGAWQDVDGGRLRVRARGDPPTTTTGSLADRPGRYTAPMLRVRMNVEGQVEERRFYLPVEEGAAYRVGRGRGNEIVVDDPHVSAEHLRVTVRQGIHTVEDVGSKWGTILNEQKLTAARPLRGGDVLIIGQTTLRYDGEPLAAPKEVTLLDEVVRQAATFSVKPPAPGPSVAGATPAPPRVGPAPMTPALPRAEPSASVGMRLAIGLLVAAAAVGLVVVLLLVAMQSGWLTWNRG